jgi:hypothetical protein
MLVSPAYSSDVDDDQPGLSSLLLSQWGQYAWAYI